MFQNIDLNKKAPKEDYQKQIDGLRLKLAALQRKAKELKIPVIILFEGWDASGKGTLINELTLPMDPRVFNVYPTYAATVEEQMRPFLWRFWIKIPARGRITIFDRSWYRRALGDRINNNIPYNEMGHIYEEINYFEEQLIDDGTVIIKFFLHISREEQKNRFKKLEANPITAWRVTADDWKHHKQYDLYLNAAEQMIEKTDTDYAPWTIIEAHDKRYANLKIFNTVIAALEEKIDEAEKENEKLTSGKRKVDSAISERSYNSSILDQVNLGKTISDSEYKTKLKKYQKRLYDLQHELYAKRVPIIIVFEGWDAAGKGGSIKRLTENLDPRGYEVVPIAAPNDIEKEHHYLWRFWKNMPKAGHITIFDRSWYGRVMVERVEGFCTMEEWKRAYKEINEMEQHIVHFGSILLKFWMHIDQDEQMRRFQERMREPHKQWKITEEDWRNREKWDVYKQVVDDMLLKTSTTYAPWNIVESNSKKYARIRVLKTVIDAVEKKLGK